MISEGVSSLPRGSADRGPGRAIEAEVHSEGAALSKTPRRAGTTWNTCSDAPGLLGQGR